MLSAGLWAKRRILLYIFGVVQRMICTILGMCIENCVPYFICSCVAVLPYAFTCFCFVCSTFSLFRSVHDVPLCIALGTLPNETGGTDGRGRTGGGTSNGLLFFSRVVTSSLAWFRFNNNLLLRSQPFRKAASYSPLNRKFSWVGKRVACNVCFSMCSMLVFNQNPFRKLLQTQHKLLHTRTRRTEWRRRKRNKI